MISTIDVKGTEHQIAAKYDSSGNEIINTYATQSNVNTQITNLSNEIDTLNTQVASIQGLEDLLSYGVEWDTSVASPILTRIGNPLLHKSLPVQNSYKGCVAKGNQIQYWLYPDDWSKKVPGIVAPDNQGVAAGTNGVNPDEYEASNLDGTDGDVCVHISKFYGKSGTNGTKQWVRIATSKIDDTWTEIPEMLVDAYRCTLVTENGTTRTASVVNTTAAYRGGSNRSAYDQYLTTDPCKSDLGKPRTALSRATMRPYAKNSGGQLLCYEYYKWIFYWNYVIEYANFNSQAAYNSKLNDGMHQGGLGDGVTTWDWNTWSSYNGNYPLIPCGYCNEFGNFSGVKQISAGTKTFSVPRWRGFDNPFGDIWTILDGIVLKRDSAGASSKVYTTTNPDYFTDDLNNKTIAGTEIASDGWTTQFDLKNTAEIIPSRVGGSPTTYMSDYHWCNANYTDVRLLVVGGGAYYGSYAGLACFHSLNGVGLTSSVCGFRVVKLI